MVSGSSQLVGAAMSRNFETLNVTRPREWIVQVELNRPEKSNAMNRAFWREIRECFTELATNQDCRAIVMSAAGRNFSAGLDLMEFAEEFGKWSGSGDTARKAIGIRNMILTAQESFNVIEKCPKPVIAGIHGACVGGAVELIAACDMRLCSTDAWFQIKEIDVGLVPDLGSLQRLPRVVGNDSLLRELIYTARRFSSNEAVSLGLVSRAYPDRDATIVAALELAEVIVSKSPVAVQGSKVNLIYSRDNSVPEGLDYVATWNASQVQTEDLLISLQAAMQKTKPVFSKL